MRSCPFCAEEIQDAAIKCKHCGEFLDGRISTSPEPVVTPNDSRNDVSCGYCGAENKVPPDASRMCCVGCGRIVAWLKHPCGWTGQVDATFRTYNCPQCGKAAAGVSEVGNPYHLQPGGSVPLDVVLAKIRAKASRNACPVCGSVNRYAKRSGKGKLARGALGVALLGPLGAGAAALGPKNRMRCVDCGFES